MEKTIGHKTWIIPDGYLPDKSNGIHPSHESVCVLNTGGTDAEIKLTLYFEDRPPSASFISKCGAKRTHHIRLDRMKDADGNQIPRAVPYSIVVESSCPVIVQHTRLDTSQSELALMTTMAYAAD
jgi:hypothetical protein